jgi:hypothetical protein
MRRSQARIPGPSPNSGRRGIAIFQNGLEHPLEVLFYLLIPKPNQPVVEILKPACTGIIFFLLEVVDISINLDHQTVLGAVKIDYERTQWMLSSKFQPSQSPVAQLFPKRLFSRRCLLAELPGPRTNVRCSSNWFMFVHFDN